MVAFHPVASPEQPAPQLDALLEGVPALAERPDLLEAARGIFRFAQFLLDEEDNLTRTGNLTGAAKDELRARTLELLGVEADAPSPGEDDP